MLYKTSLLCCLARIVIRDTHKKKNVQTIHQAIIFILALPQKKFREVVPYLKVSAYKTKKKSNKTINAITCRLSKKKENNCKKTCMLRC